LCFSVAQGTFFQRGVGIGISNMPAEAILYTISIPSAIIADTNTNKEITNRNAVADKQCIAK
jgi:hypothetical protein